MGQIPRRKYTLANSEKTLRINEDGFMDPFENYYADWTDVIRKVNEEAHTLHEKASC